MKSVRATQSIPLLLALTAAVGCRAIGPATIPRDRFDYSDSITESWKRQTLLNIVKVRYVDPPSFVEVSNIVAGYTLETTVSVGGQISSSDGDSAQLGGTGRYTDRPTITYVPMTGNRFLKGLMTPVSPESLFFTIQSGWPADVMLSVGVTAINGLRNEELSLGNYRPRDAEFARLTELMREIQLSGGVGLRIVQSQDKRETSILGFHAAGLTDETKAHIAEVRRLLGLDPETNEFSLVYGSVAANDREIAVLTRSVLHMNQWMAMRAELPPSHVKDGRAVPGILDAGAPANEMTPLIRCTEEEPQAPFVKVRYRDHWFWVDDLDLRAKRALTFMMLLFTLADTGERENLPLVTIPAQ